MNRAILAWLALGLTTATSPGAATWQVPDDFPSVQAAIDGASVGDRIELAPGRYYEGLDLRGGISLVGMGQEPGDVILEGEGVRTVGTLVDDTGLLVIENLTIREGFGIHGAGLYLENARIRLDRVTFVGCGSMLEGGAFFARDVDMEASFCVFYRNYSWGTDGAAIYLEGQGPLGTGQQFENCTFAGTSLCCGNVAIYLRFGTPRFDNCILEEILCGEGAQPVLSCNSGDFCGVDGGGHIPGDPRFCDLGGGDLRLGTDSPCLPENNGGCGLIGALGSCNDDSPARAVSFGHLKTLY